jgi:hypothetical protein
MSNDYFSTSYGNTVGSISLLRTTGPPVPSLNNETNIYWLRTEYRQTDSNPYHFTAPIYEGDSSSPIRKQIGYVIDIVTESEYPNLPYSFYTDNWSFYFLKDDKIVATMNAIYDFIGEINNPFYIPGTKNNFNTTNCGYDLLNKSGTISLIAGPDARQCTLQIFD